MLGGFRTIIVDQGRRLRFMTAHQLVKTWYLTALLRPLSFLRCGQSQALRHYYAVEGGPANPAAAAEVPECALSQGMWGVFMPVQDLRGGADGAYRAAMSAPAVKVRK